MIKKAAYTVQGINQDLAKSKTKPEFYYSANNIRTVFDDNGNTGAITVEKGNSFVYSLPSDQVILGYGIIRDYLVLFSKGNTDQITRVDMNDYTSFVLFDGDLGFVSGSIIETESYFETESIQKIYWIDGINQLRYINIITDTTYTQDDSNYFNIVPVFQISSPEVESISYGGIHTAGMIQYAYTLIKKHGSQTALSPLSELKPLKKQKGGGEVNALVGQINNIVINNVDTNYDIIRLYAFKYTSYNQEPVISLIAEESITESTFKYSDDGRVISNTSQEELIFLGGTPIIPGTITSKYNRLIVGDIKEQYFDINTTIDENYYDTRAYRFKQGLFTSKIKNVQTDYQNIKFLDGVVVFDMSDETIPIDHDCINDLYDEVPVGYNYQAGTFKVGATGTNIDIEIEQVASTETRKLLKSNEIYRYGIEFFNEFGQFTPPHWICDLKTPTGNLNGVINTLKVTLRNTEKLTAQGVVGWRVLRVERTEQDKTILTQGIVTPSMFQYQNKDYALAHPGLMLIEGGPSRPWPSDEATSATTNISGFGKLTDKGSVKLPSPFIRNIGHLDDTDLHLLNTPNPLYSTKIRIENLKNGWPISGVTFDAGAFNVTKRWLFGRERVWGNDPRFEIYRTWGESVNGATFVVSNLDTRMFSLYSPESVFLNPILSEGLKFTPSHFVTNTINDCAVWGKQFNTLQEEISTAKRYRGLNLDKQYVATGHEFHNNGKIGGGGGRTGGGDQDNPDVAIQDQIQYYRKYNFEKYNTNSVVAPWNVLGTPTLVGKGEHNILYNSTIPNISEKYFFNNSLFSVVADRNQWERVAGEPEENLLSVTSIGNNCILMVEENETPLENLIKQSYYYIPDSGLAIMEIRRVLANQYGGNTYENRSRNSYLRIGTYNPISTTTTSILRAGDTFVGDFLFERICPNVASIYSPKYHQYTEMVSVPLETSIDLSCRHDLSINGWDSKFQPSWDEFHAYNRVYSQEPITNLTTATNFLFELEKTFSNRILATKVKTPGEIVDSWTSILLNEELFVDGKYGGITKLIRNKENVYCFQSNAVSYLIIQPRVAVQSNDNIGVELGTGKVLYDYKYISTESGSTNKLGIFNSPDYIYYVDVTNKTLNRITGTELSGISDSAGLHSYMKANLTDSLKDSNLVCGAFDNISNLAYFTTPTFTLAFSELTNLFHSFYDFKPTLYFKHENKLLSTIDNNDLYEHYTLDYANYYGVPYEASITFICAPENVGEVVFNNLSFYSEYSDVDGVDLGLTTPISSIQVYNNYQDSGTVNLVNKINIFRKFREWNIILPRDFVNKRDRIRGEWAYIKLNISNTEDNNFVLHDVILSYTV